MMRPNVAAKGGIRQTALAQHTSSAAETTFTAVTASLPGGAVGRPIGFKASGSVGGIVQFQFGSAAVYQIAVAPNQLPVEYKIPPSAFPNKVSTVTVSFQNSGGIGTNFAIIEFETD